MMLVVIRIFEILTVFMMKVRGKNFSISSYLILRMLADKIRYCRI